MKNNSRNILFNYFSKTTMKNLKWFEEIIENIHNNNSTNKKSRKRVVKKVKEVLNNKNEIIQEKSADKKITAETKTSKSGWWERKL